MANRFWVGGGSANTWAATANTNWASTSGGANNASVPGASDVAIFDSNSGTGNSVIGASVAIQGLDCTGGTGNYAGTITHNTAVTLTINTGAASSLRLTAGMTYTPASTTSLITFTHTSGTANITCAGQKFAAITINGAGGTTQQLDAILINAVASSILTITSGIYDCNGFALTVNQVAASGATTRSLLLGGTVTLGGNLGSNSSIWTTQTTTGLTFTKNSANIVILPPNTTAQTLWTFHGGALTYNNITLNASTNTAAILSIQEANTFAAFTIGSGWTCQFPGNATTVINAAFTWTGTQANPLLIQTTALNTLATISVPSGTCTMAWGGLSGITAAGGATFVATNTFSFPAPNAGWAITPPSDSSSAGIATAVWTDLLSGTDFSTSNSAGSLLKAMLNQQYTSPIIGRGTCTTGGTTTSVVTSAFTPNGAVANQFAGRVIIFDATTATAALQGQAATITASSNAAAPTFTVSTMTTAPSSGDTFSVI